MAVPITEYELVLAPDVTSKTHTQWFYFSVSNTQANRGYTFHIVNFIKPSSMYNHGQMPLMYSVRSAFESKEGVLTRGFRSRDGLCLLLRLPLPLFRLEAHR